MIVSASCDGIASRALCLQACGTMVKLSKSTKLQKYKCTRLHAYKKHRTAVKRVLHGKWSRGHILTKITLGLTCDDFTLSLGPLEANIYVFSGGLSEND